MNNHSGEQHTSYWPSYYRDKKRHRTLAFLSPQYDNEENVIAYYVYTENHDTYFVDSLESLLDLAFKESLDIYVHRISVKRKTNDFIWLKESESMGATIIIPHSSGIISNITYKRSNKVAKVIATCAWGYKHPPSMSFLLALRHIFDYIDIGEYPSQGSLGQELMIEWHRLQGKKRYHRPNHHLRHKLFSDGSGGRRDDFDLSCDLDLEYQSDINNSYAAQASSGVPVDTCETIRLINWYTEDLSELQEYKVSFCQARITIPDGSREKFGPFYTRSEFGKLSWQSKPGVYYGWWWSPMLKRCVDVGYKVEIGFCYCWRDLDRFLELWADNLIEARQHFSHEGMTLEEDLCKGIIVSAIGYFAMRDEKQILVGREHKQEGDEPYLDLLAECDESMITDYFIRTIQTPNSNQLTQVAYYVIMKNNIELYDRALAEEAAGNYVISTYYDMVATKDFPTQPIGKSKGQWKFKVVPVTKKEDRYV